jgi:PAS domain S-box-containing protein
MSGPIETKEIFESEDAFRVLFEQSPEAIFLIDTQAKGMGLTIKLCNKAAWKLHGYSNKFDLINQSLSNLWAGQSDLRSSIMDIKKEGSIEGNFVHRRKDGGFFPVTYYCAPIQIKGVDFLMIVVKDITYEIQLNETLVEIKSAEGKFQAIFDHSPNGIVIIDPTKGEEYWPIEDCNRSFWEMNGYEDKSQLIGKDINKVNFDPQPRHDYYEKLKIKPISIEVEHERKDGTVFPIQSSTCIIEINSQERILGIDRDITKEKDLNKLIDDLRLDVGRTFHTLTETLLKTQLAVTPTLKALVPDPFGDIKLPSMDNVWNELTGPRNELVSELNNLTASVKDEVKNSPTEITMWNELEELVLFFKNLEENTVIEQRSPVLRSQSRRVIDLIDLLQKNKIRQEPLKAVRRSAEQLERMTCLIALHQLQNKIIDTDYMVKNMRERIVTGYNQDESPGVYEFWDLVQEAMEGLSDLAESKGIDFRKDNRSDNARVNVVRRDIVRAINNLLHNAIKYSWLRDQTEKPWIGMESYTGNEMVFVSITDYGVAIPKDEIEKDLIFHLGYRGRLASQKGRIGTGIGLGDSRDMAKKWGGNVTLSSRPAKRYLPADIVNVPHIKTAVLYLPIYKV